MILYTMYVCIGICCISMESTPGQTYQENEESAKVCDKTGSRAKGYLVRRG